MARLYCAGSRDTYAVPSGKRLRRYFTIFPSAGKARMAKKAADKSPPLLKGQLRLLRTGSRRFQMEGEKSSSMGNSSSRPASMSKDSSSLEA